MPVDYKLGKIYKLESKTDPDVLPYFGSTAQQHLYKRLGGHVAEYKLYQKNKGHYITSFSIIETGDYHITLVELCPCDSVEELRARERHYIQNYPCVNKVVPGRTMKEYYVANAESKREKSKQYYKANTEKILEKFKQYYKANPEKIVEKSKLYYKANSEKILDYQKVYNMANTEKIRARGKQYCADNKEKIAKKKNVKVKCACGSTHSHGGTAKHSHTKKHQKWLTSQS
jgi:hypothetical protein